MQWAIPNSLWVLEMVSFGCVYLRAGVQKVVAGCCQAVMEEK